MRQFILEKIVWESKFISSCEGLVQDFPWAGELLDVVAHNELPKVKYYKEVHQLKNDKSTIAGQN